MASDTADKPLPERALRTVTPPYRGRSDTEMNLVGYLLIGGLLVPLIPLGPIILLAWGLAKVRSAHRERGVPWAGQVLSARPPIPLASRLGEGVDGGHVTRFAGSAASKATTPSARRAEQSSRPPPIAFLIR